jgi:hypothetical protein
MYTQRLFRLIVERALRLGYTKIATSARSLSSSDIFIPPRGGHHAPRLAFRDLPSQYKIPEVISKFIHGPFASNQLEFLKVHILNRFARLKNEATLRLCGWVLEVKKWMALFFSASETKTQFKTSLDSSGLK